MSDNSFDRFIKKIDESKFDISKEIKEKAFNITFNKISNKDLEKKQISPANKRKTSFFSLKNIAVAFIAFVIVSAFIPHSPINAMCQKIFSFIPGVGVVQNEGEEGLIKAALNEPVMVNDGDEYLEVISAYIANNTLSVSLNTNIGTDRIIDIKDKHEVLKYFSGETMPGIYLQVNGQKVKLSNYSTGNPSLETKCYTVNGYFYIDEKTAVDQSFQISMDEFSKTVVFKLSPVKNGITPKSMGSTLTINDIIIFANTIRSDSVLSVTLSTVAPKTYQGIRFHLYDDEKDLFSGSVYVTDIDGTKYPENEDLRKQNNGKRNTFYFIVPDGTEIDKIVFPQFFYSKDYASEIKIKMPEIDKPVDITKDVDLDDALLKIECASIVPKDSTLLSEGFRNYDRLKIDYSTGYKNNKNRRIMRIIPDIYVPDNLTGYRTLSSSIFSELLPFDRNEGYALVDFDGMDKTEKIIMNLKIEYELIGPFEVDLREGIN